MAVPHRELKTVPMHAIASTKVSPMFSCFSSLPKHTLTNPLIPLLLDLYVLTRRMDQKHPFDLPTTHPWLSLGPEIKKQRQVGGEQACNGPFKSHIFARICPAHFTLFLSIARPTLIAFLMLCSPDTHHFTNSLSYYTSFSQPFLITMATTPQMIPIPSYQQACLAADQCGQSFYLVGSSTVGNSDVFFVTDSFVTQVNHVVTQNNIYAWNYDARKACFRSPTSKLTHGACSLSLSLAVFLIWQVKLKT